MTEWRRTPENEVIADLAQSAASRELVTIADGREIALVLPPGHNVESFDLDAYQEHPARKHGHVQLHDADSLIEYVNRHNDPATTTLWAHLDTGTVVAVLNDHANADDAGWGDHRATLTLQTTEDWRHWLSQDGKLLDQRKFAEHLEDGADAIVSPTAAEMLEIAQTFHALNNVQFRSANQLASGEVQLLYQENVEATAGQKANIEVPRVFELGLAPFEGTDNYRVQARFRYRINEGRLVLSYKLIRPDRIRKSAFADVLETIAGGVGHAVLLGVPRS